MCQDLNVCETSVPVAVVSVPRSRRHLRAWLDELGWPPPARDDVLLAVGEAVTNAVEHSGDLVESIDPAEQVVDITASVETTTGSRRMRVRVCDHGRWREPGRGPERLRFGISVMFGLMDEVSIVRSPVGTEVTLLSSWVPDSMTAPPRSP